MLWAPFFFFFLLGDFFPPGADAGFTKRWRGGGGGGRSKHWPPRAPATVREGVTKFEMPRQKYLNKCLFLFIAPFDL